MTREELDDAVALVRQQKHAVAVHGRYLSCADDVSSYEGAVVRLAWDWLDRAERRLVARFDQWLRGKEAA